MISNLEELEIYEFTELLGRFVQGNKALNYQSKDELLTPNIDKVVVLQRLLVGYRDSVPSKGWIQGFCPVQVF